MAVLALLFGALVGLSLGLTGGGGAIFAVPLLVFGLAVEPRDAVGISLAAVGATAAIGFFARWKAGQVELATGLLFAVAGMVGAPVGSWVGDQLPGNVLLVLFAVLMVVVALRMWRKAAATAAEAAIVCSTDDASGPTCRRDAKGELHFTSRCALLLIGVGLATGILSGMFGVGGGFVIVPALVLFSGMSIHRAVGTSLLVIALVSVTGVTAHLIAGRAISLETTSLFITGGLAGMFAGQSSARRLSGTMLQKGFALAIVAVAAFVILRTVFRD